VFNIVGKFVWWLGWG